MGIFDKAKDLLAEHSDKVDKGIDQAAGLLNQRTGGQHAEHIAGASEQVKQRLDGFAGTPEAAEPAPAADAGTDPVAEPRTTGPADAVDPEGRI